MTNKIYKITTAIFAVACLMVGVNVVRAENYNAGFIPGQIWFSKNPFFDGDKIKIYTAIYNYSDIDIHGFVEFTDNGNLLKNVEFSMAKGSAVRDLWIDYTATGGDHEFAVKILEAKKSITEDNLVPIELSQNNAGSIKEFVDGDNDHDGIGNRVDPDDDNDGISDLDEIKNGTNPFVPDKIATSSKPQIASTSQDNLESKIESNTENFIQKYLPDQIKQPLQVMNDILDNKSADLEKVKSNVMSKIQPDVPVDYLYEKNRVFNADATTTPNVYKEGLQTTESQTTQIKDNILSKIKSFPQWAFVYLLSGLLFLLNHRIILILVIFIVIFLIFRKIVKIFSR